MGIAAIEGDERHSVPSSVRRGSECIISKVDIDQLVILILVFEVVSVLIQEPTRLG